METNSPLIKKHSVKSLWSNPILENSGRIQFIKSYDGDSTSDNQNNQDPIEEF